MSPSISPYQTFSNESAAESPKLRIDKYFRMFPYLHDEIKVSILSFVAEAPLEGMPDNYPRAPLTHSLNQVNRNFRKWCSSDLFWKDAIIRMISREPKLWNTALQNIRIIHGRESNKQSCFDGTGKESKKHLDSAAFSCLQQLMLPTARIPHYKALYETVVNQYLRFKGPVVYMPGQVAMGQDYELQFVEYGDRVMIAEILKKTNNNNTASSSTSPPPVYFIHANRSPLEPTIPAVLVKILHCEMLPNGSVHVQVHPVHYIWLERIWIERRKENDGLPLFYAQSLKMGRHVTDQMNRLQRQEALVRMMDHLVQQLQMTTPEEENDDDYSSSSSESDNDDDDGSSMDSSDDSYYTSEDEYLDFPNDENN
jgi:hypothetical protein